MVGRNIFEGQIHQSLDVVALHNKHHHIVDVVVEDDFDLVVVRCRVSGDPSKMELHDHCLVFHDDDQQK